MIAVIAGTGQLPVVTCRVLRMMRKPFFVVALFPEDNRQELAQELGDIPLFVQEFFKPSALLALLKEQGATQILMIGKVDKMRLLKKVSFDAMALKILGSMVSKSDVSLMERIVAEFGNHGFEVVRQDQVLADLMVPPGVLTQEAIRTELRDTITLGIKAAIAMSAADIGQTVVVKDKMVLAVEAIEGTDQCIARGIALGNGGVTVCKAAHDGHNNKFDLPTLGTASLAGLQPGQVQAIAWRSTHTLIIDREAFIARAQELGIALVSV